jgi:hypothetical protein
MNCKAKIEKQPYYAFIDAYSASNKEKAKLGETAFCEALSDFPVMVNVTYGKRQKDIDHLVFTGNSVVMNECKNINENFEMHYSWFLSHVVNRFSDGLPVAQYYAHTAGYNIKNIKFTLTIPKLNCEPLIRKVLKGLKIHVIETGVQLLRDVDKPLWHEPVRRSILSVINSIQANTGDLTISSVYVYPVLDSKFNKSFFSEKVEEGC